jgi:hypothetical protein
MICAPGLILAIVADHREFIDLRNCCCVELTTTILDMDSAYSV